MILIIGFKRFKELMVKENLSNFFKRQNNVIIKNPILFLVYAAFFSIFVAFTLDTITYYNANLTSVFILNLVSSGIILISFFFMMVSVNKTYATATAIMVYTTLVNIIFTNIYFFHFQMSYWQEQIFRDAFSIVFLMVITVYALKLIHLGIVNILFASMLIYIALLSKPSFISDNVTFLIIISTVFSYSLAFSRKKYTESVELNKKLAEDIYKKEQIELAQKVKLVQEKASILSDKLEYNNKKLISNTLSFSQNIELLIKFKETLKTHKNEIDSKVYKELSELLRHTFNLEQDQQWEIFEKRFNEVYIDFYNKLIDDHPLLTAAEKKLAAFIKLGMSSKEIAQLLNNTVQSVQVSRSRLRKKLQIQQSDNLYSFLSQY